MTDRQQEVRKAAEKEMDRLLKTFKMQAKRDIAKREFDVEAVGLSGVSLELAKIGQQVSSGEQNVATAYCREMVLAVKQLEGIPGLPAREFMAAAQDVINDVLKVVETDPLIDPKSRKEVAKVGEQLLSYVLKRGNVFNRLRQGKNSLLKRTKSGLADTLQEHGGLVLGQIGKFMRRSEEKDAQQKSVAEVAASSRRGVADAAQFNEHESKESSIQRLITPRDEMGKFLKRGPWFDSLRVLKDIHGELKGQRGTKKEREAKIREANERMLEASDNGTASPQRIAMPGVPSLGMNVPKSGMLGDLFKGLLTGKGGGIIGLVGKSLGALGAGAAVVGAGLLGWKIGEQIDKWTGASNLVQKSAEWLFSKTTGQPTGSEQATGAARDAKNISSFTINKARQMGADADISHENAIKFIQDKLAAKPSEQKTAPAVTVSDYTPKTLSYEDYDQKTSMDTLHPGINTPQRVTEHSAPGLSEPKDLHFSSTGFTKLVASEGLRTKAYQDTRDVWTIGVGETEWNGKPVSPSNPGREITREEAMQKMSTRVIKDFEPMVRRGLKKPVTQDQFDSLVHLAYNTPRGAKKIINKVNKGEAVTREDFMGATKIKEGERGLVTRREKEFAMFNGDAPRAVEQPRPSLLQSTSATRNAQPVMTKSAELAQNQQSAPIIVAANIGAQQRPTVVQVNPTPIPVPIRPTNDDMRLMFAQKNNSF